MRKILATLATLALLTAQARAAEYTVAQCLELMGALSSLDTYEKDGKKTPYELSVQTRTAMARDLTLLKDIRAGYEAKNLEIILAVSGGSGKIEPGSEEMARYSVQQQKVLAAKQDLTLVKFKTADWNLEKNPIPPSTLSVLFIVTED